jgi:hypothetical protein
MPLSEHEQKILEDIERQLQQEDPRFAHQVSKTSLYSHLARRIRWASLAFIAGFVMLVLYFVSVPLAIAGFAVMLASTLLIYRWVKRIGSDQLRAVSPGGKFSIATLLARVGERFRNEPPK